MLWDLPEGDPAGEEKDEEVETSCLCLASWVLAEDCQDPVVAALQRTKGHGAQRALRRCSGAEATEAEEHFQRAPRRPSLALLRGRNHPPVEVFQPQLQAGAVFAGRAACVGATAAYMLATGVSAIR